MSQLASRIFNPLQGSDFGGAGSRCGDCLCVDCSNLPYVSGCNQFTNTKFTKPNTKISKSLHHSELYRLLQSVGRTDRAPCLAFLFLLSLLLHKV